MLIKRSEYKITFKQDNGLLYQKIKNDTFFLLIWNKLITQNGCQNGIIHQCYKHIIKYNVKMDSSD